MKSFLFLAVLTFAFASFASETETCEVVELSCVENFYGDNLLFSQQIDETQPSGCMTIIHGNFGPGAEGKALCEEALVDVKKAEWLYKYQ